MTKQIKIETKSYNPRRYGKPWIAHIEIENGKLAYKWGDWVGTPGEEGILILTVDDGDVIATGHRDNRKGDSNITYYLVTFKDDGEEKYKELSRKEVYEYLSAKQ